MVFPDYELLDCGGFEKLERFGKYVLARPEPQALWPKRLPSNQWDKLADAWFSRSKENAESGTWRTKPGMPDQWYVSYQYQKLSMTMRLGMTSFKHVGIFPEQAHNWNFLFDAIQSHPAKKPTVLNLFAYTGGASLAACAAGADVTHVDSVKQVITWSKQNMEASGFDGIRWVVEDALKFVQREQRRGKKYHGIILDPPAYGRGPDGERWVLEKDIAPLMEACSSILEPENSFCVLNLYSMGFSPQIAENILMAFFKNIKTMESGELSQPFGDGMKLPLGVYARMSR